MPVHDWRPELDWVFWDFRLGWLVELSCRMNDGLLPGDYFGVLAIIDRGSRDRPDRRIDIRRSGSHEIVSHLEIVSPRDAESEEELELFARRVMDALDDGKHVTVLDVLPDAGHRLSYIQQFLGFGRLEATRNPPLAVVAYTARPERAAYLDFFAVGSELPAMPLFLTGEMYVPLPAEETYMAKFDVMPASARELLG